MDGSFAASWENPARPLHANLHRLSPMARFLLRLFCLLHWPRTHGLHMEGVWENEAGAHATCHARPIVFSYQIKPQPLGNCVLRNVPLPAARLNYLRDLECILLRRAHRMHLDHYRV